MFECFCYAGLFFALVILFKLGKQGRNINFINVLFVIVFLYEVIVGPFLIYGLLSAAKINWDGEPDIEKSVAYCSTWYVPYKWFFLCIFILPKVFSILCHRVWINVFEHRNDFYKVDIKRTWNQAWQINFPFKGTFMSAMPQPLPEEVKSS